MRFRIRLRLAAALTLAFLLPTAAVRTLFAEESRSAEQHQRAAKEAEGRGDFKTAVREYKALVALLPQNAELQSNLGVALYFNHDLKEATAVFHKAISLKEELYTPHLFLGVARARLSQPDDAVAELKKAIAIDASDPLAHTWLGYALVAQSHYEPAIEQLEIARQQDSTNSDVEYALGQAYLELGKRATAELIGLSPDGGRTWQLAAEQAEAQGKLAKALSMYQAAFERRPDVVEVRAKVQELTKVDDAAGQSPSPIHPEPAEIVRREDEAYKRVLDDESKAKEAFERVSQIDPDCYRAHEVLGDAYVAGDRFDDAIAEYRKVLERKADLPSIHGAICNALSRTGRIQEAIAECEAELVLTPESAEAYTQAARVELLANQDARAEVNLQKALHLDRPPLAAYKQMGKVQLDRAKYRGAAENLSHYLEKESGDSSAYYLLSRAYKGLGETQRMKAAIADYQKSLAAPDKGSSEARKALQPASPDDQTTKESVQP